MNNDLQRFNRKAEQLLKQADALLPEHLRGADQADVDAWVQEHGITISVPTEGDLLERFLGTELVVPEYLG